MTICKIVAGVFYDPVSRRPQVVQETSPHRHQTNQRLLELGVRRRFFGKIGPERGTGKKDREGMVRLHLRGKETPDGYQFLRKQVCLELSEKP